MPKILLGFGAPCVGLRYKLDPNLVIVNLVLIFRLLVLIYSQSLIDCFYPHLQKKEHILSNHELIECDHMPVPMPAGSCSICNGNIKPVNHYRLHPSEVLLESGRTKVNGYLKMWYPYRQKVPNYQSTVHVTLGWASRHILDLVEENKNLAVVEFCPYQKQKALDWLEYFANQPGGAVGVVLRSRK